MNDPFWLEFRVGLWIVAKYVLGVVLSVSMFFGGVWLYQAHDLFRLVVWWTLGTVVSIVLLFIAIGGICSAGEAELRRRRNED